MISNEEAKDFSNYRELKTEKEARNFQNENYKEYCEKYKEIEERMSDYKYRTGITANYVECYLGNMFEKINDFMRNGGCRGEKLPIILMSLIDRLNELIICAPPLSENIIVYRGIDKKAFDNIMSEIEMRNQYEERAFMSTSLRRDTILNGTRPTDYILKIYVPKGALVLGVDNITNRNEEEMLFPEKQWLDFIDIEECKDGGKPNYRFKLVVHNCTY